MTSQWTNNHNQELDIIYMNQKNKKPAQVKSKGERIRTRITGTTSTMMKKKEKRGRKKTRRGKRDAGSAVHVIKLSNKLKKACIERRCVKQRREEEVGVS